MSTFQIRLSQKVFEMETGNEKQGKEVNEDVGDGTAKKEQEPLLF